MNYHPDFSINVCLPPDDRKFILKVHHQDEAFDFIMDAQTLSIINNGDNSWSLIKGELSQEIVNIIGQAIEDYYQQQTS